MNVFEYAKKMELDGIHFYLEESARTSHRGIKRILQLLIDEEQKHYNFFESLLRDSEPEKLQDFPLSEAENIFRQMWQNNEGFDFSSEQVEIYRKALQIEERSRDFYIGEAQKTKNRELKEQLLMLSEEEQKHVMLMDSLVEYINRPNEWVEHAMFSQFRPEY